MIERSRWNGASVYEAYPWTFKESRRPGEAYTGHGNLRGVTEAADYLSELGVDAIWLTPFYPSPMVDGGYDISDYEGVHPELGTIEDAQELIRTYHDRGIMVMIDYVPNHTSDRHPWFTASRSSVDNPRRDWYIWRDPAPDGGKPNSWTSVFSTPQLRARERGELIVPDGENTPAISAWQFDQASGQYYLRDFAAEQPNLNWQNPEVREALKKGMRTWLRRGVDGFRVDVANHLGKDPLFRDEAPNPDYREGIDNPHDQHQQYYSLNYPPTLYPYLRELTALLDEDEFAGRDLRMVLECWMKPDDLAKVDRVAPNHAGSFYFTRLKANWNAATHKFLLDSYYDGLPKDGIGNQVLSNHDIDRVVTRLGERAARAAATINLTLPRTMAFVYNGEEGGFANVPIPPSRRRDNDLGERDGERAPMLWNGGPNAGFSGAPEHDLWLPIDPNYQRINLERQARDPHSFYSLYRTLLHIRRAAVTRYGDYTPLATDHPHALAFASRLENEQTITLTNFADIPITTQPLHTEQSMGRIVVSSLRPHDDRLVRLDQPLELAPDESVFIVRAA